MDIIMNFLALVIIAEFDDYLVVTIEKNLPLRMLINGKADNEFLVQEGGRTVRVNDLLRWEFKIFNERLLHLNHKQIRFNVPGNKFCK